MHSKPAETLTGQGFLICNHLGRVVFSNDSVRELLRIKQEAPITGLPLVDVLSPTLAEDEASVLEVTEWLQNSVLPHSGNPETRYMKLATKDERILQGSLSSFSEQYCVATFDDVTTRLGTESKVLATANRDQLTGIGNRSLLEIELDAIMERLANGEVETATVLFLDLDRFKTVNDTLGHAVGDELLRLVSERLQSSVRGSDILVRMGGDEFAILLYPSPTREVASTMAARMIDLIQRAFLIDGQIMNVGVSIGVAVAPFDGISRVQLLKNADLALYHSKTAGRGVHHFFAPAMEEKAQRRRALELDLRKALVLRQFELHYQPQVNVENQAIIGLKALLRWRHPQRGLVLAADFMPLAEEIGLAVPIGDWVLKTACREASQLPDSITIAVSVSALQFESTKFVGSVEHALSAVNLPGVRLEIELKEDILQKNGPVVLATINALRALGVKIAMDSFGTGVASLSQLVNFPFDKIKIDRSLMNMHQDEGRNRAVVRAISALGESLGISTLAEGVETPEHLARVRLEGCSSVQGFYYSKPIDKSELAELFQDPARSSAYHQVVLGEKS